MNIWAISDLHLAMGTEGKDMSIFGDNWSAHHKKIELHWKASIKSDDLVLIAGDISWAINPEEATVDLKWIDHLPGQKVLLRGNHDYWWKSISKVKDILPPSLHIIQNNSLLFGDISISGSRLWDSDQYSFEEYIDIHPGTALKKTEDNSQQNKIFQRELQRLELSLKAINPKAKKRIAITHYPPIGADLKPSIVSNLLEQYNINTCIFGHLHSLKKSLPMFGNKNNIDYILTSSDYLNFKPIQIFLP